MKQLQSFEVSSCGGKDDDLVDDDEQDSESVTDESTL